MAYLIQFGGVVMKKGISLRDIVNNVNNRFRQIFLLTIFISILAIISLSAMAAISSLTVVNPNGGEYFAGLKNFSWSFEETNTNGFRLSIIDYTNPSNGIETVITTDTAPSVGTYTQVNTALFSDNSNYKIWVKDNDGGIEDVSDNIFTVDNTAPVISTPQIVYPNSQQKAKDGNELTINVDITDATAGVSSVVLDASELNSSGGSSSIVMNNSGGDTYSAQVTISYTGDSDRTIRVNATDNAGNKNTNTATVSIDNTAPAITSITTKDTNSDGNVETATIVFSEDVLDSSFDAEDFSIDSIPANSISTGETENDNLLDVILSTVISGTDVKNVTYTQGAGTDLAGNLLASVASGDITESDGASPVLISAITRTKTRIDVIFSEILDVDTLTQTDFAVSDENISLATVSETNITLTVSEMTTNSTSSVTYTQGNLADGDGDGDGNLVETKTVTSSDGISPEIVSAVASDGTIGKDGIDSDDFVTLVFGENTNQFAITGANIDSVLPLNDVSHVWVNDTNNITSAVWQDAMTLKVTLAKGNATPTISVGDKITPSNAITDSSGNAMAGNFTLLGGNFNDLIAPNVLSIRTQDNNTNGKLDRIIINFDESMDNKITSTEGFTVSGYEIDEDGNWSTTTYTNDTFAIILTELTSYDTSAIPDVTYDGIGDLTDASTAGNDLGSVSSGAITETDSAPPALVSAITGSSLSGGNSETNKVIIAFSEEFNSGSVAVSDIIIVDDNDNFKYLSKAKNVTTLILTLNDSFSNTDSMPTISIDGNGILDLNGNSITSGTITASDGISPQFNVAYDKASPVKAGSLVIEVNATENLAVIPNISINQQGSTYIIQAVTTTCTTPFITGCTYTYTVNSAAGSSYLDGTATVTLTGIDSSGNSANNIAPNSGGSFVIDTTNPSVSVSAPDGNEILKGGSSFDIAWSASDSNITSNPIKLEYYDGTSWLLIAQSEANDGSYSWTVPSLDITNAKIMVTADDSAGNSQNRSSNEFTIDSTNPAVMVIAPNGNEILKGGSSFIINWTATDDNLAGNPIKLEYYNGTSWLLIAQSEANDGNYSWTVPIIDTTSAKVRVTANDSAGNNGDDSSDNNFIIDSIAPAISQITNYTVGEIGIALEINATITDSASGVNASDVKLYYNNGTLISLSMANTSSKYTATIPAQSSSMTLTYYLIAKDNAGNSIQSSIFTTAIKDLVLELNDAEWNLISVPKKLSDNSTASAFGTTESVWEYDSLNKLWVEPANIQPGKGYWVSNRTDAGLNYGSTSGQGDSPGFDMTTVDLGQGWNLIGHMCTQDQNVSNAFPTSVYNNLFVLRYNEQSDRFEIYSTQGTTKEFTQMKTGEGYWVFLPTGNQQYTNVC